MTASNGSIGNPTIPNVLRRAASRFAQQPAIEDGDVVWTFAELERASRRAGGAFLSLGVEPGDRVAIWAPNVHEWIVAALGAQIVGGVLVPINTRFKASEAGHVLRTSRARVLVTFGEFLKTNYIDLLEREYGGGGPMRPLEGLPDLEHVVVLRSPRDDAIRWSAFLDRGGSSETAVEKRCEAISSEDISDILFTSGTTGRPKGVMTAHGQNVEAFAAWSDIVGLRRADRYLIANPFFHAFGYKAGWLACLLRGATILPHAVFDPTAVLERIAADRVTVLPGPPTLYQSFLAQTDLEKFDLSSLRLAVTGAATIPVDLIRRMKDDLGFETVITGYGLTEACGVVSMSRAGYDLETTATTCGQPIPGVDVRIVRSDGTDAGIDEAGEVLVRGYTIMKGYFDDPDSTAQVLGPDGWLRTGDIGARDCSGNLRITDRKKDMFIVGGFNCYPAEIENLILGNRKILQVAVVGVPDGRLGEVGVAFVVPAPASSLTESDLIAWCRHHMANYKVPRQIVLVDALPTNASGKVAKNLLRERARQNQRT